MRMCSPERVLCLWWLPVLGVFFVATNHAQPSQQPSSSSPSVTFRVPADEIGLTFTAFDSSGAPLADLAAKDLRLWDNGKTQDRILMLESYRDLPIHAGFVFDVSTSMQRSLAANRAALQMYVSRFFREQVDRAFVMQFDEQPVLTQPWTSKRASIIAGAASIRERNDHLPLTSILDSLYTACRDQWPQNGSQPTGNFILLFSDGIDDDSHAYLSEAVDMCQRSRTAIYAISSSNKSLVDSEGQRTLEELTSKTGGRVFFNPKGYWLWKDLQLIEAEQRNQYRLVYKPSSFKADGQFHRIRLHCTIKGARVVTRSGYYAFARP